MSPREWQQRIRDILDAISEIQHFTEGMVFDTFRQDEKTIRAVEMDFIIIGECAAQIPEELKKEHPHIPWDLMRAMRNRLVHAYFGVDEQLMWDTIHNELPPLVPALKKLLE